MGFTFKCLQPKLSNEISAPYEVPQFPIEQIESKLLNVRKASVCPSTTTVQVSDQDDFIHENIVPHFQRVNISGEDITGYSAEELRSKSVLLQEAIELRQKYMNMSQQTFSADCVHYLQVQGVPK